jgi:hypothetical protein
MRYDKKELLQLLDAITISALLRLYGITYKQLAAHLFCTRQNLFYLLKNDKFKDWQREKIFKFLHERYGLEITELIVIHYMLKTKR